MPQAEVGSNGQAFYGYPLLRITRQRQVSCQVLVFIAVFQAFDRDPGDKFFNEQMLRYALGCLPVPEPTTTRKETRSMVCKMVGQGDEAGEKLVCTVTSRLAMRLVSIYDTTRVWNFTDQVIRRGISHQNSELVYRHGSPRCQRGNQYCTQGRQGRDNHIHPLQGLGQ